MACGEPGRGHRAAERLHHARPHPDRVVSEPAPAPVTPRWAARNPGLARVARCRYAATGLDGPRFDTAEGVVRWFGAVQAQEYWPAIWGLSQRLREPFTEKDIEAELDTGRVVRTHVLRPTWHWVPVTDLPWMLQLTGARVRAKDDYYAHQVGMTPALYDAALSVIAPALAGKSLTRKQLRDLLGEEGIQVRTGQLMGHLMMAAELDGLVCSGPRAGREHTYALLADRLAGAGRRRETGSRSGFLGRLVTTFLRSHGPATAVDFRWWSGLSAAEVREALESAGAAVREESLDGLRFWSHAEAPGGAPGDAAEDAADASEPRGVRLLQAYDEYTVAFTQSKPAFQLAVGPGNVQQRPGYPHTVLDGTQLAGHWRARRTAERLAVAVRLYRPPTRRMAAALDREAARQAAFAGLAGASVSVETA